VVGTVRQRRREHFLWLLHGGLRHRRRHRRRHHHANTQRHTRRVRRPIAYTVPVAHYGALGALYVGYHPSTTNSRPTVQFSGHFETKQTLTPDSVCSSWTPGCLHGIQ